MSPLRVLVFPEDLQSGPTTIWSNSHLRRLDGVSDVRRGAAYLCQFAGTESRRPVGLFTNLARVKAQMVHGWPRLYKVDNHYLYDGPLNDHCSCKQPHTPMKGVNSNEEFHSSASSGFGKQFWLHSLQSFLPFEEHVPLRAGGTSSTSSSLSPSHLSSAPLFSLSRHSGSDSSLYDAWSSGTVSRGMLSEFYGPGSTSSGDLSKLCRLTRSPSGLGSADTPVGHTGTWVATESPTTASFSPFPLETPLVTVSPRGNGTGTHGALAAAPVTAVTRKRGLARPCPLVFPVLGPLFEVECLLIFL